MESNKDAAEQYRDLGASVLRKNENARAVKLLKKSLSLYPLPGVEALLTQAERKVAEKKNSSDAGNHNSSTSSTAAHTTHTTHTTATNNNNNTSNNTTNTNIKNGNGNGNNIRPYTPEQAKIIKEILQHKDASKAHYRVLGIREDANENDIKKAYRKKALKLHPDKNSAPQADEAFKMVGLAYATLSDPQKREIYNRYGEEDPDNMNGGMNRRRNNGGNRHPHDVSPEDIFNMFFNGGSMGGGAGGGPGFRVYSNGNGFHFGNAAQRPRGPQQQQPPQPPQNAFQQLLQLLPLLLLMALSFFNFDSSSYNNVATSNQYFSLTSHHPHTHPLHTKLVTVKDIPFFVSDKFMRTYARDRYQLAQVERMVEKTYEKYLVQECTTQKNYKQNLGHMAMNKRGLTRADREKELDKAKNFELSRCDELKELFGYK